MASVWVLHTHMRFRWRPVDVGLSLAVVGLAAVAVEGGLVRLAVPRLGEHRAVVIGLALSVLGFVGFASATRGWMMVAVIFPSSVGFGFANPTFRAVVSREVSVSEQGELQGALGSIQSLAAMVGPIVGTTIFSQLAVLSGSAAGALSLTGAPFLASALVDAIALLLVWRLLALLARTRPAPPNGL